MNATYDLPFRGDFFYHHQQQQQQQQMQQGYAHQQAWPVWPQVVYQPNAFGAQPQPFHRVLDQQMPRFPAAASPSCPTLYSLSNTQPQQQQQQQVKLHPAHQHTLYRLVPSQIPTREVRQLAPPQVFAPQPVRERQNNWLSQSQSQSSFYGSEAQNFPLRPQSLMRSQSYDGQINVNSFPAFHSAVIEPPKPEVSLEQQLDPEHDPLKGLKLIPASASVIPPHVPMEKSGVPLCDFAVELVWEVCINAREQALAMAQRNESRGYESSPGQPGSFGSIGGERAARKRQMAVPGVSLSERYFSGGSTSYLSSPESPASPMTPPSSTISTACPIPACYQNGKAEFFHTPGPIAPWTRDRWEDSPADSVPSVAFKRFVKDLLVLTLVTPQVLILALHYVVRVPSEDNLHKFTGKKMPYQLMLGALICANKMLDCNSFRNSTWSTVSSCPVADINASESLVFRSLNFDLNVQPQAWATWLHALVERRARQTPEIEDPVLSRLCQLVDEIESRL